MRAILAFLLDESGAIHAEYFLVGTASLLTIFVGINTIAKFLNFH
jgi:Flp pilus assembly pilin Flp